MPGLELQTLTCRVNVLYIRPRWPSSLFLFCTFALVETLLVFHWKIINMMFSVDSGLNSLKTHTKKLPDVSELLGKHLSFIGNPQISLKSTVLSKLSTGKHACGYFYWKLFSGTFMFCQTTTSVVKCQV